ncbi:hypothetical protein QKW52_01320 [Bacillus sonorensis]|nr:hypothetical protein [Bacillus sonorensis]
MVRLHTRGDHSEKNDGHRAFFGILALAVFYVFSLMADPFDARNAEEITMTLSRKNGRPLRIEKSNISTAYSIRSIKEKE